MYAKLRNSSAARLRAIFGGAPAFRVDAALAGIPSLTQLQAMLPGIKIGGRYLLYLVPVQWQHPASA